MEDRLGWTNTMSAFALQGVDMPDVLMQMRGHLRTAVVYFLCYRANQHSKECIDKALDALLLQYGHLVQETWNMQELMTHNLHTCMLHVSEQARLCGAAAFASEWWLERLMQVFKLVTKYRCTRFPETTVAQDWLACSALEELRMRRPHVTALLDEIRGVGMASRAQDSNVGRSWLSGRVHKADKAATDAVAEALRSVEIHHGSSGKRVTLELQADDVGKFETNAAGGHGEGIPIVGLSTAKTSTTQGGKAQVRTRGKDIAKENWHALVPYTLEMASPAAQAAELAMAAAAATADLAVAV
jgi:hypothetical protein